jgi:hypothetical protein
VKLIVAPPRVIGEPDDPDDDPSRDFCSVCGFQRVYRVPPPRKLDRDDDFRDGAAERTLTTQKTPATAGVRGRG